MFIAASLSPSIPSYVHPNPSPKLAFTKVPRSRSRSVFTKQAVLDVVGTVPRPAGPWGRVTLRIQGTDLVLRSREAPTNRYTSSLSGAQGTSKPFAKQSWGNRLPSVKLCAFFACKNPYRWPSLSSDLHVTSEGQFCPWKPDLTICHQRSGEVSLDGARSGRGECMLHEVWALF